MSSKQIDIFEIHKAAKEYFDKQDITSQDLNYWEVDWGMSVTDAKDVMRLQFLDKTFDLFSHIVTKEDLIFCEKEPMVDYFFAYGEGNPYRNDYSELKEAWQKRKQEFEPLFLGEWTITSIDSWRIYKDWKTVDVVEGASVKEFLDNGAELNHNSDKLPPHFKEVIELI